MAEEPRPMMYAVAEDGRVFRLHPKTMECAASGCRPAAAPWPDPSETARQLARYAWIKANAWQGASGLTWHLPPLFHPTSMTFEDAVDAMMRQEARS